MIGGAGIFDSLINFLVKTFTSTATKQIASSAEGGILPLLAGLASQAIPFLTSTVLPALGVGALSGLASSGVQKLIGNGLYIKKGGYVCEIETDERDLVLEPITGKVFAKWRRSVPNVFPNVAPGYKIIEAQLTWFICQ